jgi:hypothetical protein
MRTYGLKKQSVRNAEDKELSINGFTMALNQFEFTD